MWRWHSHKHVANITSTAGAWETCNQNNHFPTLSGLHSYNSAENGKQGQDSRNCCGEINTVSSATGKAPNVTKDGDLEKQTSCDRSVLRFRLWTLERKAGLEQAFPDSEHGCVCGGWDTGWIFQLADLQLEWYVALSLSPELCWGVKSPHGLTRGARCCDLTLRSRTLCSSSRRAIKIEQPPRCTGYCS